MHPHKFVVINGAVAREPVVQKVHHFLLHVLLAVQSNRLVRTESWFPRVGVNNKLLAQVFLVEVVVRYYHVSLVVYLLLHFPLVLSPEVICFLLFILH